MQRWHVQHGSELLPEAPCNMPGWRLVPSLGTRRQSGGLCRWFLWLLLQRPSTQQLNYVAAAVGLQQLALLP